MSVMPLDTFLKAYAQAVILRAMRYPRRVYLGDGIMWEPTTSFWRSARHPVTPGPTLPRRRRRLH